MKNTDQVYRFMEDVMLNRATTDLLEIFKPLGIAFDKRQSDTCTVGSVFQIWNEVCAGSPAEIVEKVAERAKAALIPEILAANLLDHRYGGKDFKHVETPYGENLFGESFVLGSNHLYGGKLGEGLDSLTSLVRLLSPSLGILPLVPASNGDSPR